MKQKVNLVFIVLFMIVITLPYLFAHRDVQGRISDMENRTLQGYPSLVFGRWKDKQGVYITI